MKNGMFVFAILVVLATLSRFLPTPPNFSPMGALALFGGAFIAQKRWAVVLPLIAMLASDVYLGLHSTMLFVYASFALVALVGWRLKSQWNLPRVWGSALVASIIFFVVTNLGVWWMTGMYSKNLEGLISCFVAAIPFFHNTLAGNLVYATALFGGYRLWMGQSELLGKGTAEA